MTSLDEAYNSPWAGMQRPRRVVTGLVLVGTGVLGLLFAMALVTFGGSTESANLYAGVTAGLGIPLMLTGIVVVLPARRRTRVGVLIGALLALAGVLLFYNVYPHRWTRTADPLAFETVMLYGIGCVIALWFVFSAIATFRLRNNPQGTVRLEVVRQGKTETYHVSRERYHELVGDGGETEQVIRELGK